LFEGLLGVYAIRKGLFKLEVGRVKHAERGHCLADVHALVKDLAGASKLAQPRVVVCAVHPQARRFLGVLVSGTYQDQLGTDVLSPSGVLGDKLAEFEGHIFA
jgi:hypothetical protein